MIATGKICSILARNYQSKTYSITKTGKEQELEQKLDGPIVAKKERKLSRAKGPCCKEFLNQSEGGKSDNDDD